jgi:primosomal protein N' (replication factor Y)
MSCLVRVAVFRPLSQLYTYELTEHDFSEVLIGRIVQVPLRTSLEFGVIIDEVTECLSYKIKPIEWLLEDVYRITPVILRLCGWMAEYYCVSLGEVLGLAAFHPKSRPKRQKAAPQESSFAQSFIGANVLTPHQQECVDYLYQSAGGPDHLGFAVAALDGVTGSGKTEVYIQLALLFLRQGKSVLLLMPEIVLTASLKNRFEAGLGEFGVAVWHSKVGVLEKRQTFEKMRQKKVGVVLAARSGVFLPLENLGLIVVDEEHDVSYKQQSGVGYHARDVAIVRAKMQGALVVLGSATLSLETRQRVSQNRYGSCKLDHRFAQASLPVVQIVDMVSANQTTSSKKAGVGVLNQVILSDIVCEQIEKRLTLGQQVIIFLNRRGFAACYLCGTCRSTVQCLDCSLNMTVYQSKKKLVCHVCGKCVDIPNKCPVCLSTLMHQIGLGTEGLDEFVTQRFAKARVLRLDRDVIRTNEQLDHVLQQFASHQADILVGTQMLVKGHDFSKVTLVVVVLADGLFGYPDFRAHERAYQTLKQVAGRAGRGKIPGEVWIQTFQPDHVVLKTLQGKIPEESFLTTELQLRQCLMYPPCARMARIRFEGSQKQVAYERARAMSAGMHQWLVHHKAQSHVLGPSEAFLEKAHGKYRYDLILKTLEVRILQGVLRWVQDECQQKRWLVSIDVDPHGN